MATSRTGTTRWLTNAATAKRRARAAGLTCCPLCGVKLNWSQGRTPSSPEADHIVPHSLGGSDHLDNIRIICRHCNQSRGNATTRTLRPQATTRREVPTVDHCDVW